MPFAEEFDDIYKFGIKGAASEVDAYAERVDEQIFAEGTLDRIFNQINKADVIVADMTGKSANVFYEVGYAHALNKIVILTTQRADDIPFDLVHRQHVIYGDSISVLREGLIGRLKWAIAEARNRASGGTGAKVLVRIGGQMIIENAEQINMPVVWGEVPGNEFRLRVEIWNPSNEGPLDITDIYLFLSNGAAIQPLDPSGPAGSYRIERSDFGPILGAAKQPEQLSRKLTPLIADPLDAHDGLTQQFRIPVRLKPMPWRTIESIDLPFEISRSASEEHVRLRLHTPTQYFDFPLKVRVVRPGVDTAATLSSKSTG